MELKKRKYKRKEVSVMFNAYRKQYELTISEQKSKLTALAQENTRLKDELAKYLDKEKLVYSTLERAEKHALELNELVDTEYALELERIKYLYKKHEEFIEELKKKHPTLLATKKAEEISKKTKSNAKGAKAKQNVEQLDEILSSKKSTKFNPKKKIADYIAATEENGFNMDEVLHPGELQLEDLCKELGLIEEKE